MDLYKTIKQKRVFIPALLLTLTAIGAAYKYKSYKRPKPRLTSFDSFENYGPNRPTSIIINKGKNIIKLSTDL